MMATFGDLSDTDLHQEAVRAADREKASTLTLLEFLAEIENRRLYAKRGYDSLWKYVHKALRYSEAQTQERVASMRLIQRVPEAKQALREGKLTLTSAARIAAHTRRENASLGEAARLVRQCENLSTREVERVLLQNATVPAAPEERVIPLTPELTRLVLDVDRSFMERLERIREARGNPGASITSILTAALEKYIERGKPKPPRTSDLRRTIPPASEKRRATNSAHRTRYIPKATRNKIRIRADNRCEYVDSESRRRCDGRSGLQFDHIRAFALDGDHSEANLRLVCKAHNLLHAIETFGEEKMRPFLKN